MAEKLKHKAIDEYKRERPIGKSRTNGGTGKDGKRNAVRVTRANSSRDESTVLDRAIVRIPAKLNAYSRGNPNTVPG